VILEASCSGTATASGDLSTSIRLNGALAASASVSAGLLAPAVFHADALCTATAGASADVFHDYEDLAEGFLGETLVHSGVTYRDVNRVSGFFPDGEAFGPDDLGSQLIIERADLFYAEFPGYGSPVNALTFGSAYIPGENLSTGALPPSRIS